MRAEKSAKELRAENRALKKQLERERVQNDVMAERCRSFQAIEDVLQNVIRLQERKLESLGADWSTVSGPTAAEIDRFNGGAA